MTYFDKEILSDPLIALLAAGMWVLAAREFPHSRQNTYGALESYHGVVLKSVLNQARKTAVTRNLQWLVWQLEDFILLHYMHLPPFKLSLS